VLRRVGDEDRCDGACPDHQEYPVQNRAPRLQEDLFLVMHHPCSGTRDDPEQRGGNMRRPHLLKGQRFRNGRVEVRQRCEHAQKQGEQQQDQSDRGMPALHLSHRGGIR
jgi:hypothetical protein